MIHSVGKGGNNTLPDVKEVQAALNALATGLQIQPLRVDGFCGARTIAAIVRLQGALGMPHPDGLIRPGGRTAQALGLKQGNAAPVANASTNLSGAAWWHANQARWPNESSVDALSEPFRGNLRQFLLALSRAKASVRINATTRSMTRAKLMRYSWDIAKGITLPSQTPAIEDVDIQWDHGHDAASKKAAQEMVGLFAIKKQPSLTSNHLKGEAVDMTITWVGKLEIVRADGKTATISTSPTNGNNVELHKIGAGYGVKHLLPDDPPHWSTTGR